MMSITNVISHCNCCNRTVIWQWKCVIKLLHVYVSIEPHRFPGVANKLRKTTNSSLWKILHIGRLNS